MALSCNPSYLGGQSSGMVWGGKVSARQPKNFEVRTKAADEKKQPSRTSKLCDDNKLGILPLSKGSSTPTNTARPCSLYCIVM
jgi:hypothetical protein